MKKIFLVSLANIIFIALLGAAEIHPIAGTDLEGYRLAGSISGNVKYNAAIIYDPEEKNIKIIKLNEDFIGYKLAEVKREEVIFQKGGVLFKMNLSGDGREGFINDSHINMDRPPKNQFVIDKSVKKDFDKNMESQNEILIEESNPKLEEMDEKSFETFNINTNEKIEVEQTNDTNYILKNPDKNKLFGNIYTSSFPPEAHFEKSDWTSGYQIDRIDQRSIFYQAGFEVGDIITRVNGEKWNNPGREDKIQLLFQGEDKLNVEVYRDGEIITLNYSLK